MAEGAYQKMNTRIASCLVDPFTCQFGFWKRRPPAIRSIFCAHGSVRRHAETGHGAMESKVGGLEWGPTYMCVCVKTTLPRDCGVWSSRQSNGQQMAETDANQEADFGGVLYSPSPASTTHQ